MSGYYPPNQHLPPQYYNVNPNAPPNINPNVNVPVVPQMISPDGSIPHGMPYLQQYPDPSLHQGYIDQYEDVPGGIGGPQGGNARMRRRSAQGEHVKHRRTRSGCFTCRNRRVKCDEARPTCERCRKGNRDCVYPEPQTSSKSSRSGTKASQKSSPQDSGSSPEDHTGDPKEPLSAIPDEEEEDDAEQDFIAGPTTVSGRDPSDTPSLIHDRSPTPPTESSATFPNASSRPALPRNTSNQPSKQASSSSRIFADLPDDVKFYLNYHKTHITLHHYAFKVDSGNCLKTSFLDLAIKHEPLLYAVVGFAAYYHTLSRPDGHMSNFLKYYNKSVSLLRQSLARSKKHSLATLMTILQLASIEELLGDWVNLMYHQRAAYEVLTRLYTPQSMIKTDLQRKILLWYTRFDLFVGLQSGGEAVLDREWFLVLRDYYQDQAEKHPDNINLKYELRFATSRLIATDTSLLLGKKAKGLIPDDEFMAQFMDIGEQLSDLSNSIDPVLTDPTAYVTDFTGAPPLDPDDIVNPYEQKLIWKDKQWTTNFLYMDLWGIEFMYKIQLSMAMRKLPDPDVTGKAYRAAQMFEALINWPHSPPGTMFEAQASLAIAILFLPKDPKTIQWCRRTLAKIESAGYIYSIILRNRMLESWGLEPSDWWLPNDEGCPRIIRSIKNFILERSSQPKDQTSDDLREMKGIFSNLTLADTPSPDRPGETSGSPLRSETTMGLDETLVYSGGSPEYGWSYDQENYTGFDQYGTGQFPGQ